MCIKLKMLLKERFLYRIVWARRFFSGRASKLHLFVIHSKQKNNTKSKIAKWYIAKVFLQTLLKILSYVQDSNQERESIILIIYTLIS